MLNHNDIEVTLINLAKKQGLSLNGKDLLDIRTQVATALAAKRPTSPADDIPRISLAQATTSAIAS